MFYKLLWNHRPIFQLVAHVIGKVPCRCDDCHAEKNTWRYEQVCDCGTEKMKQAEAV